MKYDILFFDADDTLLDFKKSEKNSFEIVLHRNGITKDLPLLYQKYQAINIQLWDQNAKGLVTKDFLKVERFRRFLVENNLNSDPEKLGEEYLETLPSQVFLIEGALDLLQQLHTKIPLVIVTNGIGVVQQKRLLNSGLHPYIEFMVISEECGYSKPDRRIFDHTIKQIPKHFKTSNILMIGDKLETDILGANNAQIDSCWFNPHKIPNHTKISSNFEILHLLDLLPIIL